jgi:hypothetical protein
MPPLSVSRRVGRPSGFVFSDIEREDALRITARWYSLSVPYEVKQDEIRTESLRSRLVRNYLRAGEVYSCYFCTHITHVRCSAWHEHFKTNQHMVNECAHVLGPQIF